ncbi:hypothetical protein EV698_0663 [Spiribacter vilamensis]|uniref:Uncharacterized protein n=1 Tax=Spiribacter vilamensis TaxID=531306 RepID=A0A4Q8CZP4_9GAMM|nr:hypothetical protein EV698_0663 [Spiribacter vilamensis]
MCNKPGEVLYRCRYGDLTDWVFLCRPCLTEVKAAYAGSYQYGGTWKSRKK